ncbi:MAG: hypothetical protein NTV33_00485 [Coprothermobacterota bacterium]|nr:hypothetical protein [Coprothermobacterota bacterium]
MEKESLRERLRIPVDRLQAINEALLSPDCQVVEDFLEVVGRYGTPAEINAKAAEARQLSNLLARLEAVGSPYRRDLEWLIAQRDAGRFVRVEDYRRGVLGEKAKDTRFLETSAVTLEISAAQYFPWLIEEAQQAIEKRELMPGRFIRVRRMKESEADQGDLLAFTAAMQVMGASSVETLDTKGTDGSNVHLGGPATITGYFGGIGQPNDHALRWLDEFLGYYTKYGVRAVLNINPGTVLLGYWLYQLGIDIEFKISVFMGNDNPYAALWTILAAKLFSREDGTTPLVGFNLSNSIDNHTLELSSQFRRSLGFEDVIRFEHHITESYKSIVIQPYNRRDDLVAVADHVANISAKHEGGEVEIETQRAHPSDLLDYFRAKEEIEAAGEMPLLLRNYLDKHDSINRTARALTEHGLSFLAAPLLHHR